MVGMSRSTSASQNFFARPERGLMANIASAMVGGATARRLLPAVIVLPLVLGFVTVSGRRSGWYGTEFGLALFATSNVVALAVLAWWTTRVITLTERDRLEVQRTLALRETQLIVESRLRSMIDVTLDPIVSADPAGLIIEWNLGAEVVFGYTEAEVLSKPLTMLMPERYRELHQAGLARLASTGEARVLGKVVELSGLRKDGTEFPCELSLSTWNGAKGSYYTGIIRDVTARRRVEATLRASEASYRQIVETAEEGICVSDGHNRLTFVNERFERMLGYERGALLGASVLDLVDDEARQMASESLARRRAGARESSEFKVKHRAGGDVWVKFSSSPIIDGSGQRQLVLADRMSSVGTLAAGVGHEINYPSAYVMFNLDMIAEDVCDMSRSNPSPQVREVEQMVADAREGAERVRKIVRGLKTFSRADREQRVPLDVHGVLDLSINMAFNEIRHQARLVKDYGTIPLVEADETRLGQVFVNLLVNASHAIHEGRADKNVIRIVTGTDEAGRVVIEVRDTGRGIRPEHVNQIFDPFFTTKDVGEGTGLGLAICHGIVTGLGGSITVESMVNVGTTFRVTLPAAALDSRVEGGRAKSSRPQGYAPGQRAYRR